MGIKMTQLLLFNFLLLFLTTSPITKKRKKMGEVEM